MLEDGRIARMGWLKNKYGISVRKPEGKSGLLKPMHINRYNIKIGLN